MKRSVLKKGDAPKVVAQVYLGLRIYPDSSESSRFLNFRFAKNFRGAKFFPDAENFPDAKK